MRKRRSATRGGPTDCDSPHGPARVRPRGGRTGALILAGLLTVPLAGIACSVQAEPATPRNGSATNPLPDVFGAVPSVVRSRAGVAVAPVGGHGPARTWGGILDAPAWSTIKVPLAIVAGVDDPDAARAAITASDNEAAAKLWDSLGGGPESAEAVTVELRRGGDEATLVRYAPTRPPYTPYGQTPWLVADAARYASSLPCRAEAATTLADMGRVVDGQRWGLGGPDLSIADFSSVSFKGGWGPAERGYVARQLGVLMRDDGTGVAVALLTVNPNGYDAAVGDLDALALALAGGAAELPVGRCPDTGS